MDRTVLALKAENVEPAPTQSCEVFAVPLGSAAKTLLVKAIADLRAHGIVADLAYGDRGLKGAMKAADKSGATIALVVGERDLEAGVAQLKDLASGDQVAVALDAITETIEKRLR